VVKNKNQMIGSKQTSMRFLRCDASSSIDFFIWILQLTKSSMIFFLVPWCLLLINSLFIYIYFCGRNMHSSTSLFCEMKTQSPEERVREKKNNKGISSGILLSFRFHFRSKFRRKWIQVQLKNK
jgi:hypothetical protein